MSGIPEQAKSIYHEGMVDLKELREKAGLTQAELARRSGISPVQINRFEKGLRRITRESALILAPLLKTSPSLLLGVPDPSQPADTHLLNPFPIDIGPDRIPIYGQAACGNEGRFEMNGEVLGYAPLIPQLANVKDAYAVYVAGDSMEPRYYSGEIVYVNPLRPARQGNFVVIQLRPDVNGDAPYGFVKRFVSMSSTEVHLEQFNPKMPPGVKQTASSCTGCPAKAGRGANASKAARRYFFMRAPLAGF